VAAGQTITVSGENTLPTTAGEYDVFLAVETDQWRNSSSTTLISTAPVATPTPTPAPDTSGTTNPTPAPSTGGLNDGTSYYVDSVAGNDANSGTSPSAAWKSTSKASSAALASGSNLLFKRGGSWTGTLTIAESGIVVASYGSGDRPKFSAGNTGGCVLVTGNDNKVFDLYIDRCGVRDGIKVNGDRNLFERNYVTHNAAGVEIPGGADSNRFYRNELIANNVMTKNTCGGDDDYGAYSFANEGGTNTDIGWNVIRDAKASSCDYGVDGSALEIYRGSANFHHNVVSGNPAAAEMSGVAWAKIEYNVIHDGEIILQTSTKFAGANTNVRVAYNTTNERILGWVGANANGALYATKNLYTQGLWSGTTGFITNVDNKQIARSALDANLKPIAGSLAYGAYAPGGMNG
jgi:hypothetical protein